MSNLLLNHAYIVVNAKHHLERVGRKLYSSKANAEQDILHGKDFSYEREHKTELYVMGLLDYIYLVQDMARCGGDIDPWDA